MTANVYMQDARVSCLSFSAVRVSSSGGQGEASHPEILDTN